MLGGMTRTDVPETMDERAVLTTLLDYTRATVHAKCEGLSQEQAGRAVLPTSPLMTVSGLVNHLRGVEIHWFHTVFLGEEDRGPWTDEDPDAEMRLGPELPFAELLAQYEADCASHRELVSSMDLDTPAKRPLRDGKEIDLRWILHHLVEETARHNGHLDIIRELIDGTRGD
jgi:uncharacterized damage-inducible protein DinB